MSLEGRCPQMRKTHISGESRGTAHEPHLLQEQPREGRQPAHIKALAVRGCWVDWTKIEPAAFFNKGLLCKRKTS